MRSRPNPGVPDGSRGYKAAPSSGLRRLPAFRNPPHEAVLLFVTVRGLKTHKPEPQTPLLLLLLLNAELEFPVKQESNNKKKFSKAKKILSFLRLLFGQSFLLK